MKGSNWMVKNQQFIGLGVLIALVVAAIQITTKDVTISLMSLLGGVALMLFVVKKWIWPGLWGVAVILETLALFIVIYFIMTMIYLIYVALAIQFGWTGVTEVTNTVFYLGRTSLN